MAPKPKHPDVERTHYTPKLICESTGVGIETVLSFIHSGELKASNVSNSSSRPRWLIAKADLAAFLEARSNQQVKSTKPAKRRPKPRREFV